MPLAGTFEMRPPTVQAWQVHVDPTVGDAKELAFWLKSKMSLEERPNYEINVEMSCIVLDMGNTGIAVPFGSFVLFSRDNMHPYVMSQDEFESNYQRAKYI
jgi:hypothetical protein